MEPPNHIELATKTVESLLDFVKGKGLSIDDNAWGELPLRISSLSLFDDKPTDGNEMHVKPRALDEIVRLINETKPWENETFWLLPSMENKTKLKIGASISWYIRAQLVHNKYNSKPGVLGKLGWERQMTSIGQLSNNPQEGNPELYLGKQRTGLDMKNSSGEDHMACLIRSGYDILPSALARVEAKALLSMTRYRLREENYGEYRSFPATLFFIVGYQYRITHSYIDSEGKFVILKSPLVDLKDVPLDRWKMDAQSPREVSAVFRWMLGEPVGEEVREAM